MEQRVLFGARFCQVYLVHIARHAKFSPRVFANPFMDLLSKTPWFVIPIFWIPIVFYFCNTCIDIVGFGAFSAIFPFGLFLWTLIEYTLHRFLFHLDDLLPDHRVSITLHFLLHGIHHFLPMDRFDYFLIKAKAGDASGTWSTLGFPVYCPWIKGISTRSGTWCFGRNLVWIHVL